MLSIQTIVNPVSLYNLNIATLQPGNYLLKIESSGDVVTKKFVKE
ncbi:MAG: T9SS type A sorting domain-containing protein [Bacteroidetes bacterium]|nr:T9SS type A sorting domain-containing protein [Bacteroidota bacterium]